MEIYDLSDELNKKWFI